MVIDVNSALLPSIGLHFVGSVPHLPHLCLCSHTHMNLKSISSFGIEGVIVSESHVTIPVTVRHS